jgi:UDP-GlcNAc:undecaprenyl-phosphate GlcNAc-1-phosphate transferase
MISAVFAFAAAMLVAIALTPLVRKLAVALGVLDRPSARRVHENATPRLGGIAIVGGFFASLLLIFVAESTVATAFFAYPMRAVGLALGGLLICSVGIVDDVRGIGAWHKFWAQCGAGVIAYVCGFRIDGIALPFFGNLDMGVFGVVVTTIWIVAIINAINLIDGLDGLAGGVAFFACVTNFVVGSINHDAIVMLLSASLGGAVLGFLLFNFNPASIFMGDSGSMFLGYVLATTSVLGNSVKSSTTVALLVPFVALGVPIIDTLLAMLRRFLERRPIFAADRGHIHHQLLAMGLTHRRAVLMLYALSVLFTASAIILSIGRNTAVGAALVIITIAVVGIFRGLGNFDVALRRWRRKERIRSPELERLRYLVPDVLTQLAAAHDASQLAKVLGDFAEQAQLEQLALDPSCEDGPIAGFQWRNEAPQTGDESNRVTIRYSIPPLGSAAIVQFSWLSNAADVSPEADILLQLVVDACARHVARLGDVRRASTHEEAPAPAPEGHLRTA